MSRYSKSQEYRRRKWTPEEDNVLQNATDRTISELVDELGRTPGSLYTRASKLGLGRNWAKTRYVKCMSGTGYYLIECAERGKPSIKRLEHRVIMESVLGRALTDDEVVHHIDGQKLNNNVTNLHVFPNKSEHHKAHDSLTALLPTLLELGYVAFDEEKGIYTCPNTQEPKNIE